MLMLDHFEFYQFISTYCNFSSYPAQPWALKRLSSTRKMGDRGHMMPRTSSTSFVAPGETASTTSVSSK